MKLLIFLIMCILSCARSSAEQKAVTDTGEIVVLSNDGTWKYLDGKDNPTIPKINTNSQKFFKSSNQKFLLKSKVTNHGLYLDPKKWEFSSDSDEDSDFEYTFTSKEHILNAHLISEKIDIPIETMEKIVLFNAKEADPNVRLLKKELRYVNDTKVLFLEFSATSEGIEFIFMGYYFSDSGYTSQLTSWLFKSQYGDHSSKLLAFLNGFVSSID